MRGQHVLRGAESTSDQRKELVNGSGVSAPSSRVERITPRVVCGDGLVRDTEKVQETGDDDPGPIASRCTRHQDRGRVGGGDRMDGRGERLETVIQHLEVALGRGLGFLIRWREPVVAWGFEQRKVQNSHAFWETRRFGR
jgi:hypothetical protein